MAKNTKTAKTAPAPKAEAAPRAKRPGVLAIEAAGGNSAIISVASTPRMVIGGSDTSRAQECFEMLRKSKTIGEYLQAREKAGMGSTLGGYLPGWVEKGFVTVGKGKAVKVK